jgi:hypothetical protein
MTGLKDQALEFFKTYSERSNHALQSPTRDVGHNLGDAFARFFVEAGPKGVVGGANDDFFRRAIPRGFRRYRRLGGKRFVISQVEITELDDVNVLARVDWDFAYERPKDGGKGTIHFQNMYLLNFAEGSPKLFACIAPDEEKAMKEHGLI